MDYRDHIAEVLKTVNADTGSTVWQQALLDICQTVDGEAADAFDEGLDEGHDDMSEQLENEYQDGYDAGYNEGYDAGLEEGSDR